MSLGAGEKLHPGPGPKLLTGRTLAVLLILALLPALTGCSNDIRDRLAVTGQIESEAVTAGSRVGGRVVEILAEEGDTVKQGDVVVRLDDADAQAAIAAARAQVAQAEALLQKLQAGATPEQIAQAEAAVRAAQEQYNLAQTGARAQEKRAAQAAVDAARAQFGLAREDYERAQRLVAEGAISRQAFDRAEAAYEAAEAQLRGAQEQAEIVDTGAREQEIAVARANLDRAQAMLEEVKVGPRREDIAAAQAARDAALAQLQKAEVALREMQVISPIDGLVESLDVRPGDLLKPGPAVRLINPDDLELTVYVSAALLGDLQIGQEITLTTDAHGDETFSGTITHIASEGEYTPRNLQTEEERVQQVFAVTLDLNSAGGKLRAGMTAIAHLPASAKG